MPDTVTVPLRPRILPWFTALLIGAGLVASTQVSYLLYHSLVELFAVVTGFLIGVVAWYTRGFSRNYFLTFLGLAYPWVATIDLVHTLAYKGMGVFPNADANLPTQLWLAARLLEAAVLLVAPTYLAQPLPRAGRLSLLFGALTLAFLTTIFGGLFPTAYVEGVGLTAFKITTEYVVVALLLAGGWRLWHQRAALDRGVLNLIVGAWVLTVVGELAFTFYMGVYDLSNFVGHLCKLASFWLVFLGVVRTSLAEPFRLLSRDSTTYDAIPEEILVVDRGGRVRQVNRVLKERLGAQAAEGTDCHGRFHPAGSPRQDCPVCAAIAAGRPLAGVELEFPERQQWQFISLAPIRVPAEVEGLVHVARDITLRKCSEQALERANRALRAISASNQTLVRTREVGRLLAEVCRIVVDKGGYRMAWVGYADAGPQRRILPQSWAGQEDGYLAEVGFSWADDALGAGPAGAALRTGAVTVANDIAANPTYGPWREAALRHGFAASMAFPLTGGDERPFGVLAIYAAEPNAFSDAEVRILGELASDLAYGIESLRNRGALEQAERDARCWQERLGRALTKTVEAVAATIEARDPFTAGHQRRVAELAAAIGRELGLDERHVEGIHMAGLIHDLGKLAVPADILNRAARLTPLEYALVQTHVQAGADIVKEVEFPWPVRDIILQHHERLDGSGYPAGLAGEAICLDARILAVADVVEAMASHRPYRPAKGLVAALAEIERDAGVLYDPEVVAACLRVVKEGKIQGAGFEVQGYPLTTRSGSGDGQPNHP